MTDKIPLIRDEVKNYDILVTRPIFVKNIYNEVGQKLHSDLESIILKTGDEWKRRLTVVQANITNLNMHGRYKEFKTISFEKEFTLQKLVNRSMDLYVSDEKFKKLIEEHRDLKPSGSNL